MTEVQGMGWLEIQGIGYELKNWPIMKVTSSALSLHSELNILPIRQEACPTARFRLKAFITSRFGKNISYKQSQIYLSRKPNTTIKCAFITSVPQNNLKIWTDTNQGERDSCFFFFFSKSSFPDSCSLSVCRWGIMFQVLHLHPHFLFESNQCWMCPRSSPHF